MKHEKSCGAVVYRYVSGTRYYLLEHMVAGHFSIPKGHVENNETEAETAVREIKEETNLDVILDTGFRTSISFSPYPGVEKEVIFFTAEALHSDSVVQECEVTELLWLPYKKAIEKITFDSDKGVLKKAHEYLCTKK